MYWLVSRQKNGLTDRELIGRSSSVEQYKGEASTLFDLSRPEKDIALDFLVILASSQDDGIKFNQDHEDKVTQLIKDFKEEMKTIQTTESLERKHTVDMFSITLKRVRIADDGLSPCYLLDMSGKIEYVLKRDFSSLGSDKTSHELVTKQNASGAIQKKTWRQFFGLYPTDGNSAAIGMNPPKNEISELWKEIVEGGNGKGDAVNQLNNPHGIAVDDDDNTLFIADAENHRIIARKLDNAESYVVAGGKGQGKQRNQLNFPTAVVVDRKTKSLLICDHGNKRIMRWSLNNDTKQGDIVAEGINGWGMAIDGQSSLYICDNVNNALMKFDLEKGRNVYVASEKHERTITGKLKYPAHAAVDVDNAVYVSDSNNHRVIKWVRGDENGIIVVGREISQGSVPQFSYPDGLAVDMRGTLYVAEAGTGRIIRWQTKASKGEIIFTCQPSQPQSECLDSFCLSVSKQNYLYVSIAHEHCVKRFKLDATKLDTPR